MAFWQKFDIFMAHLTWIIRTRFSPYEILPIDQENKYLVSHFIMKLNVVWFF